MINNQLYNEPYKSAHLFRNGFPNKHELKLSEIVWLLLIPDLATMIFHRPVATVTASCYSALTTDFY